MSDEISVPVWYSNGGGMMVRRDCLEPEHPESTYNYIKNVLGKTPENYGYHACQLHEEQLYLLSTIPDESLEAELRRREKRAIAEYMYG